MFPAAPTHSPPPPTRFLPPSCLNLAEAGIGVKKHVQFFQMTSDNCLREAPYVLVVYEPWFEKVCFSCLHQLGNDTFPCKGCSHAWYCSMECKKLDWESGQHRYECATLAHAAKFSPDMLRDIINCRALRGTVRMLGRSLVELTEELKPQLRGFPSEMKERVVDDLMDHSYRQDLKFESYFEFFQFTFAFIEPDFESTSFQEFRRFLGVWAINGFEIVFSHADRYGDSVGSALYLQSSRFDHTCDIPDLNRHFEDAFLVFKPINDKLLITAANIDQLKINYRVCDVLFTPTGTFLK